MRKTLTTIVLALGLTLAVAPGAIAVGAGPAPTPPCVGAACPPPPCVGAACPSANSCPALSTSSARVDRQAQTIKRLRHRLAAR